MIYNKLKPLSMNRKNIDYNELAKQKKKEDYAKAISRLPVQFRPQPSTKKTRARTKVHMAKKRGKLIPQPCQVCGELKTEAHHPDYNKPLDVIWLCKEHHMRVHYPLAEKREPIIKEPKYTQAQIVDNVSALIKSKQLIKSFIKRRTPKTEW